MVEYLWKPIQGSEDMDNNQRQPDLNPDIPDFGSRQEMDLIRHNEDLERQARLKRAAALQKQERLRQRRIKQLKETVTAWAILIFIVIAVIAIIISIASSGDDKDKDNNNVGESASTALLQEYEDFNDASYSFSGNDTVRILNGYTKDNGAVISDYLEYPSYYYMITESSSFLSNDLSASVTDAVRDCPQFSNGYIWSSGESMKFPVTDGYLYDTNASFICAADNICKWNGDTDFLYKTDGTTAGSKDISNGLTVLAKIENAANYYFDKNDLNGGGIRYNDDDSLVYVLTTANSGVSGAKPSNIFHNHSFGYLDLYNNLLFNKAMRSLSRIYTSLEDNTKSGYYKNIAEKNSKAINEKFWNNSLGRYSGYIDKDGKVHDLGFTAVNLFAIECGVADKDKSDKILSWIDGDKKVNTDTSSGAKIYKDNSLPIFNTVCALKEGWFDLDGSYPYSGNSSFGKYWQNGAQSYSSAYFNIGARSAVSSSKKLKSNCEKLTKALDKTSASLGEDIFALAGAYLTAKELFGISTDGEILYVSPIMSTKEDFAIRSLSFSGNNYGFSFDGANVLITADLSTAVKIKVGSFEEGTAFTLSVIEDGKILSEETVKADKEGYVSVYKRFGSTSFIALEKQEDSKKK